MPRITAAVFVFLLVALFSLIGIGLVTLGGPALAHGNMVEHDNGKIGYIDPSGTSFVLKANGKDVHFECRARCLTQLNHMRRHLNEHASTDVYFVREANNLFMAIDVD